MKNLLKKLHMMQHTNQTWDIDSSEKSKERLNDVSSTSSSGISGWLNSVTNRPSSPSSNVKFEDNKNEGGFDSMSRSTSDSAAAATIRVRAADSGPGNSMDPQVDEAEEVEEEYQIQLALELSAREDPEAVQIEAVKQISLESCPPQNTPAEVLAYRYWVSSVPILLTFSIINILQICFCFLLLLLL